MTHTSKIYLLSLLMLVAPTLMGCDATDDDTGTYVGDAKSLGNGGAYAFITLDDGEPTSIGVSLDELALSGLSSHETQDIALPLPTTVAVAPFNHVALNWNPHGHEPDGVYTIPHFDFHFYMVSEAELNEIDPARADFADKAAKMPEGRYIPAGYIQTPGAVPRMGAHWVDPTSPEFTNQGFSRTFIYGFWDAQMNFLEPMITKSFIESVKAMDGQSVQFAIPQPQAFARPGYYPTHYSIRYNANRASFLITLEGLTEHR